MRKLSLFLAVVVVLAGLSGLRAAEEYHTLKGSFVWHNEEDTTGDLEARFTSTGKDKWKVTFHFDWEGEPRVFSGTAEGSLTGGTLSGKVKADQDKGRYTFTGTVEDGTFRGTHAYIDKDGKAEDSGTLTLKT